MPWLVVGGAAAGLVVVAVLAVVVVSMVGGGKPAPTPTPAPLATPRPLPTVAVAAPRMHEKLALAEGLLSEGKVEDARKAFATLTADEIILFSRDETALYDQLKGELEGLTRDAALKDLDAGLEQASITKLRRAIPALGDMSGREIAEVPGLKDKLARAREAVRVYALLKRAAEDGDHPQTLERSAEMLQILPNNKQARDWREAAARSLEADADAAVKIEDWDKAARSLQTLRTYWPDRAGLSERLQRLDQVVTGERRQQEVLDTALARGRAGDVEGALETLNGVQPQGRFTRLFADARSQLQAQLAKLDEKAPAPVVVNPEQLQFKKKEPARIYIRITDDYKVVGAKAMVRTEAVRVYKEMPLKKTAADQYLLEIPPEQHGGGTIEFYVEATDRSGHVGRLSSPEAPFRVERKKWWKS